MLKSKKLSLARETLVLLSTCAMPAIRGGAPVPETALEAGCEESGIIACPSVVRDCPA